MAERVCPEAWAQAAMNRPDGPLACAHCGIFLLGPAEQLARESSAAVACAAGCGVLYV